MIQWLHRTWRKWREPRVYTGQAAEFGKRDKDGDIITHHTEIIHNPTDEEAEQAVAQIAWRTGGLVIGNRADNGDVIIQYTEKQS